MLSEPQTGASAKREPCEVPGGWKICFLLDIFLLN